MLATIYIVIPCPAPVHHSTYLDHLGYVGHHILIPCPAPAHHSSWQQLSWDLSDESGKHKTPSSSGSNALHNDFTLKSTYLGVKNESIKYVNE